MRSFLLPLLAMASLAGAQTPTLELDLGGGVAMELILVRPGTFQQGSPASEPGREADEGPQRSVTLSSAYYLGRSPVTRGQFACFVEATGFRTEAEKGQSGGYGVVQGKLVQQKQFSWRSPGFAQTDDHPVVLVSALDAEAFCKWLTGRVNRVCALPTEAQWEHACRAGSTTATFADPAEAVAWFRQNSGGTTQPVGQKRANAWGFQDCYGPVWQWCADWYAPYPPGNATDPLQTNPNLSDKPRRVLRGGSFLSDVSHARSAERYRNDARSRNADNGFRIVCATTQRATPPAAPQPNKTQQPNTVRRELPSTPPDQHIGPPEKGGTLIGFLFGLVAVMALPVTIVALLVWKIVQHFRGVRGVGAAGAAGGLTGPQAAALLSARPGMEMHRFGFQLTDDGFFITGPESAVGTTLRYACQVAGRELADDVLFTPGPEGHFVFTGRRPSSVRLQTTGGAAGTTSTTQSFGSSLDDDDTTYRRSSSSSRFPSAY